MPDARPELPPRREGVPVTVLTGFLGSGKTTLLKRILETEDGGRTAVLINEYGEVGLDHLIVSEVAPDVVLLKSGCVCCAIRGELRDALATLLSQRERGLIPRFERIVLETTGLADPGPIIATLLADPVLKYHCRLSQVVCVVDTMLAGDEQHPDWFAQVGAADTLVLSKTALATPVQVRQSLHRLSQLNPVALVLDASDQERTRLDALEAEGGRQERPDLLRLSRLGGRPDGSPQPDPADEHPHQHTGNVQSFCLTFDPELEWASVGIWLTLLLNAHGSKILRVKGLLNVAGHDGPVVLHGVQHLVHPPVHLAGWPSAERSSRLVFIVDGLDVNLLKRSFNAFALAGRARTRPQPEAVAKTRNAQNP